MTDTPQPEPTPAQAKLRQIVSTDLYSRLPEGTYRCAPDSPRSEVDPVSIYAEVPLAALTFAAEAVLPPNYVWKPHVQRPNQLEAWSPNLKEGATSTSLRVVWKDCWDRWTEFTGWSMKHTLNIMEETENW